MEVTDGVQISDGVRRNRPMAAWAWEMNVLAQAPPRRLLGARSRPSAAGGCAQQQGLGEVNLGRVSMTAPA